MQVRNGKANKRNDYSIDQVLRNLRNRMKQLPHDQKLSTILYMYSWKARLAYDRLVRSGCSDYKIFLLVTKIVMRLNILT